MCRTNIGCLSPRIKLKLSILNIKLVYKLNHENNHSNFYKSFFIVGIYIFHLFPLFETHNTQPTSIDYLAFSLHSFLVYVLLHFILILPLNYILKLISKTIAGIYLSLGETFFLFLALADTKIYISQGLHAYDRIVVKMLQNPHWEREL